MPLPPGEPDSAAAVADWVRTNAGAPDRFAQVYRASEEHRTQHGARCTVYPTSSGPFLGLLVRACGAKRILEVGSGLGYSALWLAFGSPDGAVETIESDADHAALAAAEITKAGYGKRILVRQGRGRDILPGLSGRYDLIFCDGDLDEYLLDLDQFLRLLRRGGLLVTSNLFLGQYSSDIPGIEAAAIYRKRILEDGRLLTVFLPTGLALSVLTP
jgi:predicted O-methyltransferase YrrM